MARIRSLHCSTSLWRVTNYRAPYPRMHYCFSKNASSLVLFQGISSINEEARKQQKQKKKKEKKKKKKKRWRRRKMKGRGRKKERKEDRSRCSSRFSFVSRLISFKMASNVIYTVPCYATDDTSFDYFRLFWQSKRNEKAIIESGKYKRKYLVSLFFFFFFFVLWSPLSSVNYRINFYSRVSARDALPSIWFSYFSPARWKMEHDRSK